MANATLNQPISTSCAVEKAPLYALLSRERAFMVRNWSILNEMRLHKALPKWVVERFPQAGSHVEEEDHHIAVKAVNEALAGNLPKSKYNLGQSYVGDCHYIVDDGAALGFVGTAVDVALNVDLRELTPRQLEMLARGIKAQLEIHRANEL